MDESALIHAEAVTSLPAEAAQDFIGDPAFVVREAAAVYILKSADKARIQTATERAIITERSNTLRTLLESLRLARCRTLDALSDPDLTDRRALVLLNSLAIH